MTQTIRFTKMHGAGNDYIYINTILYNVENPKLMSRQWSQPHTGIGSDGLVLIGEAENSDNDYSMRIFNADGSEAMMCGNASRCIGKYLYDKNLCKKQTIRLETLSGVKELQLTISNGHVADVVVDMMQPQKICDLNVTVAGRGFQGVYVSMGNPHFVTVVDDVEVFDVAYWGNLLEHCSEFADRANIEFVQIVSGNEVRVRVWERGSGITQACGTGACATIVATNTKGLTNRMAKVVMDGGTLSVDWRIDDHVYLGGPAEFVFEGEIQIADNDDKASAAC